MNLFKPLTLSWWQVGIFKLTFISLGIIIGVYFQAFFLRWVIVVAFAFALSAAYLLWMWRQKTVAS